MRREKFTDASTLIKGAKKILLATHESPDGDGVASMLAFYHALEAGGRGQAILWAREEIPSYLRFLPASDAFTKILPDEPVDLVIAFDYGDFKRLGIDEWVVGQRHVRVLTFDHHPAGGQFGTVNIIDPAASSTAELVYDFFESQGIEFGKDIARCLLCGILLDTGFLEHENATPKTFRTVKNLLSKGAFIKEIIRETGNNARPIEAVRMWGEALLRIKVDPQSGLALSFLRNDDFTKYGTTKESMTDFSSLLASVSESRLSAFLTQDQENPQFIKGSLRSSSEGPVNVSLIARHFGGGGHARASGFRTPGSMEEVMERLIYAARTV